ncbi:MAG: serine hydrolase domain-containing protein [Bacillota bacterium]|nr:serine hydrolase domain-containing protein [Bacillota bacterium]
MRDGEIAKAGAIVLKADKTVCYRRFGYSDTDKKTPLEKGALFRLASVTKPIVTIAVMIQVQRGAFLLEDKVSKFS